VTKVRKLETASVAARLDTPTDLPGQATNAIAAALNAVLADTFALQMKTRNFHWHVSGPHFRDYHRLFDEQIAELGASIDELAERVRKIGRITLRSIGDVARLKRIEDNEEAFVAPSDMLRELLDDNKATIEHLREAHKLADEHDDIGTAQLLEQLIDATEKRTWFLFEASRSAERSGH
jgi:starvation-inducible DNA-binding protein